MSKADTFENDLLKLIYQAVPIANICDNAAVSPLTQIFYALHSADPGEAGTQATNEVAYTGYARVAVARTVGGHTVTGSNVSPVAAIPFGACTAGTVTATFFSTGVRFQGPPKSCTRARSDRRWGPSPRLPPMW